MFERKTLNLSEIQLSYLEWNRGKEPLLLLHGLADRAMVWLSLGNYLSDRYHIIAPDLRGHGDSSKPDRNYGFTVMISDLETLMESLGWQNAHILGHSWAAKLAAIWASKHSDRFRSLMLVDPFFIGKLPKWFEITFPLLYRVLPFLKLTGSFASYAEAEAIAKNLKQYRGWTNLQQQVFQAGIEQKEDGSCECKFAISARNEIFAEVMSVDGLTEAIAIPSLLIKPKQGLNRSELQLKPYKKYLSNLQICEIPGNHWVHLVEPEAFNLAVADFLRKLAA
jgi:pimeloyl-ACP methyl ester carboxylesterase